MCWQCRKVLTPDCEAMPCCDGCGTPRYCDAVCQRQHWLRGHDWECSRAFIMQTKQIAIERQTTEKFLHDRSRERWDENFFNESRERWADASVAAMSVMNAVCAEAVLRYEAALDELDEDARGDFDLARVTRVINKNRKNSEFDHPVISDPFFPVRKYEMAKLEIYDPFFPEYEERYLVDMTVPFNDIFEKYEATRGVGYGFFGYYFDDGNAQVLDRATAGSCQMRRNRIYCIVTKFRADGIVVRRGSGACWRCGKPHRDAVRHELELDLASRKKRPTPWPTGERLARALFCSDECAGLYLNYWHRMEPDTMNEWD